MEKLANFQKENVLSKEEMNTLNGGGWRLEGVVEHPDGCTNAIYRKYVIGIGTKQLRQKPDEKC